MSTIRLVSVLFVILLLLMGISIISTGCTESEQAQIQTIAAEAGQTAVAEAKILSKQKGHSF